MIENLQEALHKGSVNNQKVQKFVPVEEYGNLIMKNTPKRSAKYLEDNICKIKQIQNIPVTLRIFLNTVKNSVISLNYLVQKSCGKAKFSQSFHTRKLGEITLFFTVKSAKNFLE